LLKKEDTERTKKFKTVGRERYDWEATYKGRSFKGFKYIL